MKRKQRTTKGKRRIGNSYLRVRREARHRGLVFQPLEPRKLLSATLTDGVLAVVGTVERDQIKIYAGDNAGEIELRGVDGVEDGTLFSGVDVIQISSFGGNDKISIESQLRDTGDSLMGVTIDAGEGNNKIESGDGDDVITAGDGRNKVESGDGADTISLGDGRNKVESGAGDDLITTGLAADKIEAGDGDDVIDAGDGKNKVEGEDGDDSITAGDGDDKLEGGDGDDVILGGDGNNKVKGHDGDDRITTGSGRDKIDGGEGIDDVDSGTGDDHEKNEEDDIASHGFWHGNKGQRLLKALNDGGESTALGDWLATELPEMYGKFAGDNNMTGATNSEVAAFVNRLQKRSGKERDALGLSGSPKMDAKVLAVALSVYVTTQSLAGDIGLEYGFLVTEEGLGAEIVSVGSHGAAVGRDDYSELPVMELLYLIDERTIDGILYDMDADGDANDDLEEDLRHDANSLMGDLLDVEDDEDEEEEEEEEEGEDEPDDD